MDGSTLLPIRRVKDLENRLAALKSPKKPNLLAMAESALRKARIERAAIEKELAAAAREDRAAERMTPGIATTDLVRDLAEQDRKIVAADAHLASHRDTFSPQFLATVVPPTVAMAEAAHELIDLLDLALSAMADIDTFARLNNLPAPRFASAAVTAVLHLRNVRAALL